MSIEFKLPSLGEGVAAADVADILVQEGDAITAGQVLLELETEKAVVELPCQHAGRLLKLLVKKGDTVKVGQVVAVLEVAGATSPPANSPPANSGPARPASPAKPEPSTPPSGSPVTTKPVAPAPVAAPAAVAHASAAAGSVTTYEFKLPSLGEGVTKADVAEVLVKEGDVIDAGQSVMELETEKAVVEVPCPYAGQVTRVLAKEGETVLVGQHVLTIRAAASVAVAPPAPGPAPAAAPVAKPAVATQSTVSHSSAPATSGASAGSKTTIITTAVTTSVSSNGTEDAASNEAPLPAAPSTRRLARELGVELRQVAGSGPGGRILQEDVQTYVRSRLQAIAKQPVRASGGFSAGGISAPALPDFSRFGTISREQMSKISRTAAENLTVAWHVIPHVTHHDRADITDLEAARKRFADGPGGKGPKVTMTAIVMKALARCLQAFPKFNSSLDPETLEIVFKHYYNIGCAVDTPNGLLVPVVKDCDRKTILEIAADLTDLAGKAREKKLSIDSMQGATCTVTNLGGIGGVGFTPIVNYPEVCILGMSRGQTELKLVNGQVQERLMLPLSLSYDHRVVNGADAARFVVALCNMLSDPFQLLTSC